MLSRTCARACSPYTQLIQSYLASRASASSPRNASAGSRVSSDAASGPAFPPEASGGKVKGQREPSVISIPKKHKFGKKKWKKLDSQSSQKQSPETVLHSLQALAANDQRNERVLGKLKSTSDNDSNAGLIEEIAGEYEKQGWGKDELAPPPSPGKGEESGAMPHSPTPEDIEKEERIRAKRQRRKENRKARKLANKPEARIEYSRRVEGLVSSSHLSELQDLTPVSNRSPIATLSHGLERVLFNPGVHWLRDPRSRVYNFPPRIEEIPKVSDFAFERLEGFVKSSRDDDLWSLAEREKRTFAGSTSSLSGILSHIYFLLSEDKPPDLAALSSHFVNEAAGFTPGQRMATSVIYNHRDGVYAIDSDQTGKPAEKNVLTWMGTMLEKYLTMSEGEFINYMRTTPIQEALRDGTAKEAYRYSKSKKFVMRSQLDCHDSRLPGTGVFDIKTRACLPIRMDLLNFEENSGYLIRSMHGALESFEREYYDLIRSAFLKYSFQARIGNMDGMFVAYHNTARVFGFQYIPLEQMEAHLYGVEKRKHVDQGSEISDLKKGGENRGDRVFQRCVYLMELLSEEIVSTFPGQSVKCTFEKRDRDQDMKIWVQPMEWEGPEEEWPIKQLSLTLAHFIDNQATSGVQAIERSDREWVTQWNVKHLNAEYEDARLRLDAAKRRQFRAYNLPSGVTLEGIEQWWKDLDFGGKKQLALDESSDAVDDSDSLAGENGGEAASDKEFLKNFQAADKRIQTLRKISRQGRASSEALELEDRTKPKTVLDPAQAWVVEDEDKGEDGSLIESEKR